jgi:hypothetical protein
VPAASPTVRKIGHFGFDTLPRVLERPSEGLVELVLPFLIDVEVPDGAPDHTWRVVAEVDGVECATRGRTITAGFIAGLRRSMQRDGMYDSSGSRRTSTWRTP